MREVITFLAAETGVPLPHFSVPLSAAYAFGWLMETLFGVLPGEPFLTRSIVYLGEDWYAPSDLAKKRLGYEPRIGWKEAISRQLRDTQRRGHPGSKHHLLHLHRLLHGRGRVPDWFHPGDLLPE